ncbi:MAG TPA: fumarylacetoacetate hydrolase family protein [Acidobacteriota bacterium]|nr:fumarylacetoacetate hydrolase family protein [Acidobacteriota bacterium]
MKYVRYRFEGKMSYGVLDGDTVREIDGGLFGEKRPTGQSARLDTVELLWPCEPSKILAVGLNYKSHIGNQTTPSKPEIFYKPPSALVDPGGKIVIPQGSRDVHFEGELVAVIGRKTRDVSPADAANCIFGFTCGNDVSERYWQKNDLQWWRAKGCDTFAPLGPVIVAGYDWMQGKIETRVNGTVLQSGNFSELLFNPLEIISHASRHLTLMPGDVVYTGTPGRTSTIKPGDAIEVDIEGIGILRNTVTE